MFDPEFIDCEANGSYLGNTRPAVRLKNGTCLPHATRRPSASFFSAGRTYPEVVNHGSKGENLPRLALLLVIVHRLSLEELPGLGNNRGVCDCYTQRL